MQYTRGTSAVYVKKGKKYMASAMGSLRPLESTTLQKNTVKYSLLLIRN